MGTQLVNMKLGHFFVASATAQWWNIGGNDNDNDVAKVDTTTTTTTLADVTTIVTGTRTSTTFTTTTSGMDTTKKVTTEAWTTVTGNGDVTLPPKTTDQTKPSKTTDSNFTTTKKMQTTTAFEPKTTDFKTTPASNVTVIYFTTPADRRSKCLQMRSDVLDSGIVGAWVPTCDENGRFTRRQCNASARMCWCVDQSNGEMIVDDHEDQKFAGFELTCEADDESHNQDGLNIWDFNLHDMISDWIGMGDKKETTEEMMANWMQSSNLANLNFAPQNTNVQNFININPQLSADVNFNIDGQDLKLSSIFNRLAQHGSTKEKMMAEFEKSLEEFGIEEYVLKSWPMIKQFAQKYGIDENCLEEIEKKFMSSF